jgi:hypothetical protein
LENPYTQGELAERMKSPGWLFVSDKDNEPATGTLEEILKITHGRHKSGREPGLIKELETAIELDMIQVELLWSYLGLPV